MNGKGREGQPYNVQAEDSRLKQCSQFGFMIDSEWTFDGNPLEFQWLVRWVVLMRELYRSSYSFTDNTPLDVLLDTEKSERAMEERGITERAITAALLSNGFELAMAFRKVDGRNCNDEDIS